MRFPPILVLSAVVILANGCAIPQKPSCPLISKIFQSKGRAPTIRKTNLTEIDQGQCGCDYCKTVRLTGEPPVEVPAYVSINQPVQAMENCCEPAEVYMEGGTPNPMMYSETLPNTFSNTFPNTVPETTPDTTPWVSPESNQLTLPEIEKPDMAPPIKLETEREIAPSDPYVDPKPEVPVAPGITVPELDGGTGFLAPQNLVPQAKEKVKAFPASSKKQVQPKLLDEVVPQPYGGMNENEANEASETLLPAKRLETKTEDLIVLKARPVTRHIVNNAKTTNVNAAPERVAQANRLDQFGLPLDQSIEFSDLPPVDGSVPARKVQFQNGPDAVSPSDLPQLPTLQWDDENQTQDQTTQIHSRHSFDRKNFVSESTVYQEPILRMTAIPTGRQNVRQDAIAKIRFGEQTIVRGQHPNNNTLNQNGVSQANRVHIVPQTRLGTIER